MDRERSTRAFIIFIIIVIVIVLIFVFILALRYRGTSTDGQVASCQDTANPTGIVAVSSQLTNINLSWNGVQGATRYRIYVGTISGFGAGNALITYLTGDTNYIVSGLVLGRTYYIRVSSINPCGAESELSPEVSVTLGFPNKFRIVSRDQPSLALKVAPDFLNIEAEAFCSGNPGDDLCIWTYDPDTGFITNPNLPNLCMKTFPESIDTRVKYGACNAQLYYNYVLARQWVYDSSQRSFCNPQNPEGLNCIKLPAPGTPGTDVIRTPYDGTFSMQWDVQGV